MAEKWADMKNIYAYLNVNVWCENCSTQEHPIQMVKCNGLFYSCPLCNNRVMAMANIMSNRGSHYASDCPRCKELKSKGIVLGRKEGL